MVFKGMEGGDQPSPKIGLKGTYGKKCEFVVNKGGKDNFFGFILDLISLAPTSTLARQL